jgi:hypothetical protein
MPTFEYLQNNKYLQPKIVVVSLAVMTTESWDSMAPEHAVFD